MPAAARQAAPIGRWPVMPLAVLSAATLIIAEAGAASGLAGGVAASVIGCVAGTALLYLAARLDRRGPLRPLPPPLPNPDHPLRAGTLMIITPATHPLGIRALHPVIPKLLL